MDVIIEFLARSLTKPVIFADVVFWTIAFFLGRALARKIKKEE